MIVTPTRDGRVSSKWHAHEKQLRNPLRTAEALETGQPVDMSRNIGISKALQTKCKYVLFFDADVLPPADGLEKLLSLRMPVVGGLYRSRGPPYQLLANKDDKPLPDEILDTPNALVECDEVGAGFLLVDMRAIKRYAARLDDWQCFVNHTAQIGEPVASFDDKTARDLLYKCRYCQQLLVCKFFDYRAGKTKKLAISEDYYFNRKMKETGFKTYVFTGVFCVHENNFGEVGREPALVTSLQSAANVK